MDDGEHTKPIKATKPGPITSEEEALEKAKAVARVAAEKLADETVDGWVNNSLRNGNVARSTEAWNAIYLALPALKAAVADAISA